MCLLSFLLFIYLCSKRIGKNFLLRASSRLAYLVAVCGLAAQHLEGLQQVGVTRRHARHHLQEQGSQVCIVIVVRKVLVEG
jgi:hypothetical protein